MPQPNPRGRLAFTAGAPPARAATAAHLRDQHGDSLSQLVQSQCGIVTRAQALDHGLTDDTLAAHLRGKRWQRVWRGIYAVHTGPLTVEAQIWAAILRAGPGAVASHETAAFLLGLADEPPPVPHVTVPGSRWVRIPGIRVHNSGRLNEARHPARSIPCTRIEETVLDLIDKAPSLREVATWITRACQRRLTTAARLREALARRKKIRWRAEVSAMVSDVAEGAVTPLEIRYLRRVERRHGLPRGRRQRRIVGSRVIWVDVDYDEFDTRVELDGRQGHEAEGAFRDRRRDNRGVRDGKATLRYGHVEVFSEECEVAVEVGAVLNARGWTGRPTACGPHCAVPH